MIALLFAVAIQQGIPARLVTLEATVDKKRIGEVVFIKQLVPGTGVDRRTTFKVEDEDNPYTIRELRKFDLRGNPLLIERTYIEEEDEVLSVTVKFNNNIANVTYSKDDDEQTTSVALIEEGASTTAVSEVWFVNAKPKQGDRIEFWEYDVDASDWVKKVVTYHGMTDLKVGKEIIKVHRITVGDKINIYVDEFGAPYKLSDKSVKGGLTLLRTLPDTEGGE